MAGEVVEGVQTLDPTGKDLPPLPMKAPARPTTVTPAAAMSASQMAGLPGQTEGRKTALPVRGTPGNDSVVIAAAVQAALDTFRPVLEKWRESLQTLTGHRGDPLDQALTLRLGQRLGMISADGHFLGGGSTTVIQLPGGGGGGGGAGEDPDLTPPPNVTGLAADGGFSNVIVSWAAATYTVGHGHQKTNIYGVRKALTDPTLPTFGDSALVGEATGALTIYALASDLAVRWHLWAKYETNDGVESVSPAGGLHGVTAETGQDIEQLLTLLTGQITASQLYSTLAARIDLIDGSSSVPGSVNFRLAVTAADLTSAFQSGDSSTYASAQTYVQGYAYSKSTVDGAFASQFNALTANHQVADAGVLTSAQAYVGTYTYAKATIDGSFSNLTTTLTAAYTAADGATITTAQNYTNGYAYAKSTGEALAGQVTTISTRVNRVVNLRIDTQGFDAIVAGYGGTSVTREDGSTAAPGGPMWAVHRVVAGAIASSNYYNTLSGTPNGNDQALALADYINGLADTAVLIVQTYDYPGLQHLPSATVTAVHTALKRLGATQATLDRIIGRSAYILVGSLGSGEGTGVEKFAPPGPKCWIYLQQQFVNGVPHGVAGAAAAVGAYAAVQLEASARTTETGDLFAQYTVKTDVAGLVSGYGLASTANNAAPSSAFGVRANQFFVAPPSLAQPTAPTANLYDGFVWLDTSVTPNVTRYWVAATSLWSTVSPALPFIIQATPSMINGVAVPAGIYAKDAFILNGSITNAKLGNAVIDDAKVANLAAAKLTAGDGTIGGNLKSANYTPNSLGWIVRPDGYAEFSFAHIRDTLLASQISAGLITATMIDSRGLSLKDSSGTVILAAGTPLTSSHITPAAGWLNSNIAISSGGVLSGAGGGTVTAAGLGAIKIDLSNAPPGILNSNVTLSGLGAGALAYISAITSANVSTYIDSAAINLANINTASIGTLGALASYLGTVEIAAGGYLRSGQTAWATGSGFWQGWIGTGPGEPGWSIGDSTAYLRYRPSTGLEEKKAGFGGTVAGGDIDTAVANGDQAYAARTVTPYGGTTPYVYRWTIQYQQSDNRTYPSQMYITGGESTATVGVGGYATDNVLTGTLLCTITDANGRAASAVFGVRAVHGTPP